MERTISFMNGEGSIGHNTRRFIADNVDASRTKNNITLIHEDIKQAYHKLFDKALKEYNAKQKRKDRQIKSYYDKISRSKQEKLFYEVIVQIGNRDDTGVGSSSAEVATWVLKDYVKKFQLRNPQLYVIGAYIHLDEETPHLHLNFIPWVSGCKRGLETKTSLKAALATRGFVFQLLKKSDYCKKIFYVYPFNTLVEQNMNSMEKIFGQKQDIMSNIAVVNSITPYKVKNSSNINLYKNEKYAIEDYQKILLDRQFLNYPIVLSTHITLFDTMFGRSKGSTFGFHQLCHSVIVLDEIQSYNNNKWGAMINFLKAYAQLLDIKIIIMSATLPNLELLTNNNAKAVRLINNREKYFNHRMFANRVKVNYELLNRKIGIAELEEHILQHKNKRILIEFIRKSSAEEFYAYISESAECPVRLITGDSSIQERKDIIADIENMQEVILVATQVIEAGVDIDMDIGYKDISRLDSEEQFIGRINRSCRKDGVVYFFNMDDAKGIYRQDVRVDTDNTLMNEEIREILNSKDFYDYYEKYVIPVLKNAQGQCNDNNIDEFIRKEVGKLDFNKVADKMKLIDDNRQMYSIYFSRNIIDKNNPENVIDGKKIWKEYKELLQDNHMSYQEKTVKLHNIRSKMNMFMYQFKIELYNENHKPVIENLEWDEQIGDIFYIENGEDYYDENGVLNKELFKDNEDLFI